MQASILPARRGWRWLVEGFAIFRRRPALLCFLVLGYWLTMTVVSAIPLVGRLANLFLIPVFSVSLMNACRLIDRKERLPQQLLFSGFHRNLQTLLILGAVYALVMLLVFAVSMPPDFGLSPEAPEAPAADKASAGEAPPRIVVSIPPLTVALLVPVSVVFNFAPVLVAWHDMSAGKSLFFSLVACLRNWRPFLLYLLALLTVTFIGVWALLVIGALFGSGIELLMVTAVMAISLILLPIWHASFYVSYRDIFVDMQETRDAS
jgi:hypothetical protein